MRISNTHTSAHVALREATLALNVRRDGSGRADLTETGYQTLAADLAATLEAVAGLLRSVGIGVPPNTTTQGLLAVAQYLDVGGLMARQASGDHEGPPVRTMSLDSERCATTDE